MIAPYHQGVVIDLGTGEGGFVYQSARQNPEKFYIGIDANTSALTKNSEKIHRKPAKGGLVNALYVHAAVEALPSELDGVANEVDVHFPWGSLLRATALGDEAVLSNLRQICARQASLKIFMTLDPERDRAEIERLGLPQISLEFLRGVLKSRYEAAGFEVLEAGMLAPGDWPLLHTSWAQRLRNNRGRSLTYIVARAIASQSLE